MMGVVSLAQTAEKFFCLFSGVTRLYDVSGSTVEVLAIVPKSEAQPWLAQFGK